MNPTKLEQLRRHRFRNRHKPRIIHCPCQAQPQHLIMKSDTVIRFAVRKYKKRLNEHGKKLSKEMFYRLVEFFNVYPPPESQQRHHCEIITTYQLGKTGFHHVLKV